MNEPLATHQRLTTDLSQYNNSWFKPGSRWKILLWIPVNVIFFNNGLSLFTGLKCFLLRIFGAKVGKGVMIKPSVNIKYPWFLEIDDYAWIGEKVWIDNLTNVYIGKNACLSQGVLLLTGNHDFCSQYFDLSIGKIVLEDGVWIGAKAIVCPGVTCKSHSVLTVASVATKDLDEYTIYSGSPAVKIKERLINK